MSDPQQKRAAAEPGEGDSPTSTAPSRPADPQGYWRANLRLVLILLVIWFFVSCILGIIAVVPLNGIHIAGFPLGFWIAQQGSIYTFIVLVFVYARRMDSVDVRYGVEEKDPGPVKHE